MDVGLATLGLVPIGGDAVAKVFKGLKNAFKKTPTTDLPENVNFDHGAGKKTKEDELGRNETELEQQRRGEEERAPLEERIYKNPSEVIISRAAELLSQIPENSRSRITMGVAIVDDAAGNRKVLVGTSEPNGYLRPGVLLNDELEILAVGPGGSHAEADIVRYAKENDLEIIDIGATRPVCTECQRIIPEGTNISTPLK